MCEIILVRKGQEFPRKLVENAFWTNEMGAGAMWVEDGRIKTLREAKPTLEKVYAFWDEAVKHPEFAFHLRFRTQGDQVLENTHPIQVLNKEEHGVDLWMMHNGTISGVTKESSWSDTRGFVENHLRSMLIDRPNLLYNKTFQAMVEKFVGKGNKLLFMDSNGSVVIYNAEDGYIHPESKCWLANKYSIDDSKMYRSSKTRSQFPWEDDDEYAGNYGVYSAAYGNYTVPLLGTDKRWTSIGQTTVTSEDREVARDAANLSKAQWEVLNSIFECAEMPEKDFNASDTLWLKNRNYYVEYTAKADGKRRVILNSRGQRLLACGVANKKNTVGEGNVTCKLTKQYQVVASKDCTDLPPLPYIVRQEAVNPSKSALENKSIAIEHCPLESGVKLGLPKITRLHLKLLCSVAACPMYYGNPLLNFTANVIQECVNKGLVEWDMQRLNSRDVLYPSLTNMGYSVVEGSFTGAGPKHYTILYEDCFEWSAHDKLLNWKEKQMVPFGYTDVINGKVMTRLGVTCPDLNKFIPLMYLQKKVERIAPVLLTDDVAEEIAEAVEEGVEEQFDAQAAQDIEEAYGISGVKVSKGANILNYWCSDAEEDLVIDTETLEDVTIDELCELVEDNSWAATIALWKAYGGK